MTKRATSKCALVTGGNNGIGYAIAQELSIHGIRVVVADLEERPEEKNIIFKKCDVSNAAAVQRLYEETIDAFGHPDILVLNAGQGIKEKLAEGDPNKWQKIIDTNVMGALRITRAFVPAMVEDRAGKVVFISSVAATQPHPYGGVYAASKAALEIIAETLRQETLPDVEVTVVSPGIVDTKFFEHQISGNNSVETMGMGAISPKEIAEDVWYILNKRKGTSINKIITRPNSQIF